jgi:tight adherence protein B
MTRRVHRIALAGVLAGGLAAGLLLLASPATAATTGRIANLSYDTPTLRIIFQANDLAPGSTIDAQSVQVRVGGVRLPNTSVAPVSSAPVTRVAVLAFDKSHSMGPRLAAAKAAADVFLSEVPPDVLVGLVTFGEAASVDVEPTIEHDLVRSTVDALTVDQIRGTALYDGVTRAVGAAGTLGARSILLLTDGDEVRSQTTLDEAVAAVTQSQAKLDAVYIGPGVTTPPDLGQLVDRVHGTVLLPQPQDLATVFERAARALSSQVQITTKIPASLGGTTDEVEVTALAGGERISNTATVDFPKRRASPQGFGPEAVKLSTPLVSDRLLPVAIGALFVGLLVILGIAFTGGGVSDRRQGRIRRRLSLYTVTGRPTATRTETATALGNSQIARSAVELAGRVVQRRDFEGELSRRLESAGVPLRAAEWMLIHLGVALGLAFLLLLVSGGAILPTAVGLLLGLIAPWLYLSFKDSRRTSAFLGQLPDTLQLIAGSLSAGYAIAQAIDTVVREGQQPITGEFNRALVEARLGVPIEDALEGVATRMKSKDFAWVVMAIRIQREVGGNLAEVLTTVAGTLRERERLRRQVKVLSAEGRLSAWILGLLPPVFSLYLLLVRPEYLHPLVAEPLGWLLLGVGAVLLTVGAAWMAKAVKVEV